MPDSLLPTAPIIAEAQAARLIACGNPFATSRTIDAPVPSGMTLREMVEAYLPGLAEGAGIHIWVGSADFARSDYVPPELWPQVRPRAGAVVTVRAVPMRGGGGGIGRTILSLAVVVAAAAVTWGVSSALGAGIVGTAGATSTWAATSSGLTFAGTLAASAAGAAAGFLGNMVVNAIAPPPTAQLPETSIGNLSGFGTLSAPTLSITGIENKANPYGPVPRIYGKVRLFPALAAATYTEIVGSDQFFRCLFDVGYGPLELSDLRIGTIPLSNFEGVETEFRYGFDSDTPIGLYSNTVGEDSYSTRLTANNPRILVTRAQTQEITADVAFNGLVTFGSGSERISRSVVVKVEYRLQGSGSWIEHATTTVTAATEQPYRYSWRIPNLASGTYEVRFTRQTADNTSTLTRDECAVTALRSIRYTPPAVPKGHCLVALRIKATNQLTGSIDSFNCVAQALLPVWNGASWTSPQATRNPAWAFCDVLRGAANKRAVADTRLDLVKIKAWADFCDAAAQDGLPSYQFDATLDSRSTVFQVLSQIAATARAAFAMRDGKFSVVIDAAQATPVQLFTPRNSWGFRGKKNFVEPPHALKCRYIDPDRDWKQHEVVAYDDGYTASNATLFETLEMFGVTRANQAWRDGRHHLAAGKLRPETYELYADFEHLVCQRGDKVLVQHDVPRWGLGAGRVKSLATDGGGNVTAITFDEAFTFEAGKSYTLRGRYADGTIALLNLAAVGTTVETATATLATPTAPAAAPGIGDLCAVGEMGRETAPMIVKAIYRQNEFNARLELVDEAPEIYTADTGTIPAFDTRSTWPGQGANKDPDAPIVSNIASDEDAMFRTANGFVPAIRIDLEPRSGVAAATDHLEAQLRRTGSGEDWRVLPPTFNAPPRIWLQPVDDGAAYDMRLRFVSALGRASPWTTVSAYVVVGRSALPPKPDGIAIHGDNLILAYSNAPNDFAGFEILWNAGVSTNAATATRAHPEGQAATSPFPMSAFPPGQITILAFAVDTAGNRSAEPAVAVVKLGDALVDNIVETIDLRALGFPGTRPNTTIGGGDLKATTTALFWNDDTAAFWGPDTSLFWPAVLYSDFVYDFTVVPSPAWVPVDFTLDFAIAAESWTVAYRRRDAAPFWAAPSGDYFWGGAGDQFWAPDGPYLPWPGALSIGREVVDIRISAISGTVGDQAVISKLRALFDVPDIDLALLDVTLAPGGSRLSLATPLRVVKSVRLDVVENGSGAVTARILDRDASLGPLVETLNAAGASVAGKVNAYIEGY